MWSFVPSFISKRLKSHPRFGTMVAIGKENSGWGVWAALVDDPKLWQCCLGRFHMQTLNSISLVAIFNFPVPRRREYPGATVHPKCGSVGPKQLEEGGKEGGREKERASERARAPGQGKEANTLIVAFYRHGY